jgi:DNA-binding NarL/FixJ family response regulator
LITSNFERDLLLKINEKYPGQPEQAQSRKRGRSSQMTKDMEARKKRVLYQRAQGVSISDLAEREYVSQETIERDLGKRK